MRVHTSTGLVVGDRFRGVAVVSVLAEVAESSGRVMSTLEARATTSATGHQVDLFVETTAKGMRVTVTG